MIGRKIKGDIKKNFLLQTVMVFHADIAVSTGKEKNLKYLFINTYLFIYTTRTSFH